MNLFIKPKEPRKSVRRAKEWIIDFLSLCYKAEGCHLLALETAEDVMEGLKSPADGTTSIDHKSQTVRGPELS